MLLQGPFKLAEAKCIGAKDAIGKNEDRLHPSCDPCGGNPNETSRRRCLVPRRSLGGHDERSKTIEDPFLSFEQMELGIKLEWYVHFIPWMIRG